MHQLYPVKKVHSFSCSISFEGNLTVTSYMPIANTQMRGGLL